MHTVKHKKQKAVQTSRGFTLLLSALISSIVLALGVSIFGIAQKQVMLSSMGRDSQFAFYTADTGAECGLYWDVRHQLFSTSSPPAQITCDGQTVLVNSSGTWPPMTFEFQFEPGGYCTQVTVRKNIIDPRTVIHSDGFSTDCASVSTSPRALQRSVELHY